MIFIPFKKSRPNETYLGFNYEDSTLTIAKIEDNSTLTFTNVPQFVIDNLLSSNNPDLFIENEIKQNFKLI